MFRTKVEKWKKGKEKRSTRIFKKSFKKKKSADI
jgi:hypothetical protein